MSFVVRNGMFYLGTGRYGCNDPYQRAQHFDTKREAFTHITDEWGTAGRRVLEVTYALRWYVGNEASLYCGQHPVFVATRAEAKRFTSAKEARCDTDPAVLFGAGGPGDTVGWKVVRLLKPVKA